MYSSTILSIIACLFAGFVAIMSAVLGSWWWFGGLTLLSLLNGYFAVDGIKDIVRKRKELKFVKLVNESPEAQNNDKRH